MTDTRSTQGIEQSGTLDRARDVAADTARRTAESIESNPLGILVGGLAVGALAGALLPRTDKERELLAPVGKRLGDTARAAIETAREQGRSELETRGFTRDAAQEQVKNLLGGLGKALSSAGTAAVSSVRGQSAGGQTGGDQGQTAGQGQSGEGQFGQA